MLKLGILNSHKYAASGDAGIHLEGANSDLELICLQGKESLQLQERRVLRWYLSVMCIMALFSQVPLGKTGGFRQKTASGFSAASRIYVRVQVCIHKKHPFAHC